MIQRIQTEQDAHFFGWLVEASKHAALPDIFLFGTWQPVLVPAQEGGGPVPQWEPEKASHAGRRSAGSCARAIPRCSR